MRRQLTPMTAVSLAVGFTLLGAACSGSGGTPSAASVLSSVDARTKATNSSHVSITVETGTPGSPNPGRRTEQGEFDYRANRARITMPGTSATETLFIGDDVYTNLPPSAAAKVSGGKPWLKRSRVAPSAGGPVEQLLQPTDPIELLHLVQKVSTGGKLVGHEKVRGADTDHYRLNSDIHRLLDLEPDPGRRAQLAQGIDSSPGATLAADLWVDGEGRARRLVTKIDVSVFTRAAGAPSTTTQPSPAPTVTVTTEWYDPGVHLNIEPPPPDQVSDGAQPTG